MSETKTYYEAVNRGHLGGWYGWLYKWTKDGNTQITIHKTEEYSSQSEAINAVIDWADDNGYEDCELG